MDMLTTYFSTLPNKIFKLLPMRENEESGTDNHLSEYLDNLCANFAGAFDCYPELSDIAELVEVRNNIVFLRGNQDVEFKRWRSIVLRSTRLARTVAERHGLGDER